MTLQRMVWAGSVASAMMLLVAVAPPVLGAHLAGDSTCTVERDTVTAGGEVEFRVFATPKPKCHHPVGCAAGDADGCEIAIDITVSGVGIVDAFIDGLTPDFPRETCPPGPLTCGIAIVYHVDHELHLDCGAGPLTTAVDVTVVCNAHRL